MLYKILYQLVGSIDMKRLQWEQRSHTFNSISFFYTCAGYAPDITFKRQKLCQVKPKKRKTDEEELSITGLADNVEVHSTYLIKT